MVSVHDPDECIATTRDFHQDQVPGQGIKPNILSMSTVWNHYNIWSFY
jgi:hypothetical protein